MSHNPSNSNEHLPAWLRGIPLPPRPSDAGEPSPDTPATPSSQASWLDAEPQTSEQAAASMPSWLADLGEEDTSAAGDVPDWLHVAESDTASSSVSGDVDVPDWLSDLGEPEAPSMQQPSTGDVPDWMQRASSETSETPVDNQSEAVPDWLRDLGEPEAPSMQQSSTGDVPDWMQQESAHADSAETQDVPNWLSADINDTANQVPAEQPDEEDLPDWLRADLESTERSGSEPVADTPDWLHDLDANVGSSSTPTWSSQTPTDVERNTPTDSDDTSAPNWLHDLDATDVHASSSSEAASEWLPASEPSDETSAQSDVPAWLQDDDSPSEASSSSEPATFVEDESGVPNWLNQAPLDEVREVMSNDQEINPDIAPFSFEGQSDVSSANPPTEAPAWLQAPSDEESSTSSWFNEPLSSQTPAEQRNMSTDVPAWLQDVDTTQGAEAEPFESLAPGARAPYDIPEWLQDAERTEDDVEADEAPTWLQTEEREEPATTDVPDWLQDEAQQSTQPSSEAPTWLQTEEREEPATTDVPDWLQDIGVAVPPSELARDVPDWLRTDESAPTAMEQEPVPGVEDVPDWLRDAGSASDNVTPPSEVPDEVPDWLQAESASVPDMSPEAAATNEDVPPWLRSESAEAEQQRDDLPPWLRDESGAPLPTSGAPGDAHLPAWLHDAPMDTSPPTEAEPAASAQDASDASTWFDDIGAEEVEEPAVDEPESEFFGGAELPTWLRPTEAQREQRSEADQRDAHALDWLSRIGGVEEEAPLVMPEEPGPRLAPPAAPVRSQEHLQAVALLERLAVAPEVMPVAAPETVPARRRAGAERLLYLVLLIVLLAGLLVPAMSSSLQVPPVVPSAQPLFNMLNNLNENDVVLVGYEWNARRISELRPLEQAVIGQLLAKKVKLVIVSTDPQGTLVAFNLRSALAKAGYERGGLDYIWLGYKPGGEVALRSLAQDLPGALRSDFYGDDANISPLAQGFRTNTPLTSLDAFSAVLVLADEPLDVQGWMEQIHRSVPQKPITFLLPAETAPITQPYMRQPNVYYLAGKSGALAYEELRGAAATDGSIQAQYGQQRLGLLVFAALLLVSIVIGGARAAANRGRNAS